VVKGEVVPERFGKVIRDPDLVSACISVLFASAVMGYANVDDPTPRHAVFAVVGVVAAVAAFLFVAHAKVDPLWKAATVILVGAASVVVFNLLGMVL